MQKMKTNASTAMTCLSLHLFLSGRMERVGDDKERPQLEQLEQDHKYNLNRTIWKLQRFVNQKPETALQL